MYFFSSGGGVELFCVTILVNKDYTVVAMNMNIKLSTCLSLVGAASLPIIISSCASKTPDEPVVTPRVATPVVKAKPKVKVAPKPVTKPKPKVTTKKYTHKVNPSVSLSSGSAKGVTHYSGSASLPYIALTFDDGPHPTHTPKLLNILKSHNVKATFYVTGQNAARYPGLIQRIVAEGHELGNHTWDHSNLTKLSDAQIRSQLNRSNAAINKAVGVKPRTFRPPYGAMTTRQRNWVKSEYGYPIIFWSVDPKDWKDRNSSLVSSRLLSGTKKGSILLLHDIHATSVAAVPRTVNGLISKGFKFVTVSQLLSTK